MINFVCIIYFLQNFLNFIFHFFSWILYFGYLNFNFQERVLSFLFKKKIILFFLIGAVFSFVNDSCPFEIFLRSVYRFSELLPIILFFPIPLLFLKKEVGGREGGRGESGREEGRES